MANSRMEPCLRGFWVGRANCRLCERATRMPFKMLQERGFGSELLEVESYAVPHDVPLVAAGDSADAVLAIREGFVKVWQKDSTGAVRIVRLLRAGDMLGLEGLLDDRYDSNATTLSAVKICHIPRSVLFRLENKEAALYREIERRWYDQLRRSDLFLLTVARGPSRQRVINLLRYLAAFAAPAPCPHASRADMAAMLDVASETAARVVAGLKQAGLLEETPEHLLFDPEMLQVPTSKEM